jgi:hypothetical protein
MLVRRSTVLVFALIASVAVAMASAAPDTRSPRIVSAAMLDLDRDSRADRLRLFYSERIRHRVDRDGRYPFRVGGYRIRAVGAAGGRALVVLLEEKSAADHAARPSVRYVRTSVQPVLDREGNQVLGQVFQRVRAHGHRPVVAPPPTTPAPPPPPAGPPTPTDRDGDGALDAQDCAPENPAIKPGAPDAPDLAFVDSNCDGIDGTEKNAIFVSPGGSDADSGTKNKPKRQIQAAVAAAAGKGRYVLAAAGSYTRVAAATGVGIYGGYDPANWSVRRASLVTRIVGVPEGVFASNVTGVELQLLSVHGDSAGSSAYGIRAIETSRLRLQRVTVTAGNGASGSLGVNGAAGRAGGDGRPGRSGKCDAKDVPQYNGGGGGGSPVSRDGGKGGDGTYASRGDDGATGVAGTPGGMGGADGANGEDGAPGASGKSGLPGRAGAGGTNAPALATTTWLGRDGSDGIYGGPGNGGGGGGGGGGQDNLFPDWRGIGNGGGGGGGGGEGGRGGGGGHAGGGSFGIYLHNASVVAEGSTIAAGNGGAGGRGGTGGPGGAGGGRGLGYVYCGNQIGNGGDGGFGGSGGQGGGGGGGAGGPSIGIVKLGGAGVTLTGTEVAPGNPGPGGPGGGGGATASPGQAGMAQAVYP